MVAIGAIVPRWSPAWQDDLKVTRRRKAGAGKALYQPLRPHVVSISPKIRASRPPIASAGVIGDQVLANFDA